jgi:DNA repair protein RadA/Sms
MAKNKVSFVCQECGAMFPRWVGKCSECEAWGSVVEERVVEDGKHERPSFTENAIPIPITSNDAPLPPRQTAGLVECDRVLGGGIVPGSLTLIGGDPGIGKSTLMLQVSHYLAENAGSVLYVSGEESFDQTRLRALRLNAMSDRLLLLTETSVKAISTHVESGKHTLVVVDSIQAVHSSDVSSVPGSVSQVRECANTFLRMAKGFGVPIFLVGHVTKDGSIAGPRVLEHLVDTVLYFEGEGKHALRILRATKNRFGSTNEVGVFEMTESGLHEVENPSALFLNERPQGVSGSAVLASAEGSRPLLVEVQALVGEAPLASPRRTATGMNPNRVSLLLAVLEKRAGLLFSNRDVFVNVAGGVRLDEPAADLATAVALASSLYNRPVDPGVAIFGEVGLAGEVRAVGMARQRIAEAAKFGFKRCIIPAACARDLDAPGVDIRPVADVRQALDESLD